MRAILLALLLPISAFAETHGPFKPPEGLDRFVRQHTANGISTRQKLQMLVDAIFRPVDQGGLGLVYDNEQTRTLEEVMADRKANCLSLTALYVASCKIMKIDVQFAEATGIGHWRRTGDLVRYERHMVAVVPMVPNNIVADFLPRIRRSFTYVVPIMEQRALALYHSNRAVELLDQNQLDAALESASQAIRSDPDCATGWNTKGVVLKALMRLDEAEQCYRKAIDVDPRDGTSFGNMENLLMALGRIDEAQKYREKSLTLRSKDPFFNAFLAEEAYQLSHYDEAMDRIKKALKLIPREPEFHMIRAKVALAQGEKKDAAKSLEQAAKWALSTSERERFESKLARLQEEGF